MTTNRSQSQDSQALPWASKWTGVNSKQLLPTCSWKSCSQLGWLDWTCSWQLRVWSPASQHDRVSIGRQHKLCQGPIFLYADPGASLPFRPGIRQISRHLPHLQPRKPVTWAEARGNASHPNNALERCSAPLLAEGGVIKLCYPIYFGYLWIIIVNYVFFFQATSTERWESVLNTAHVARVSIK